MSDNRKEKSKNSITSLKGTHSIKIIIKNSNTYIVQMVGMPTGQI